MKLLILLAAGASALLAAPSALAEDHQALIAFKTAELSSEAGLAALRSKIESAAEQVCVDEHRVTLSERRLQEECVAHAVEEAEAQLQSKLAAPGGRQFAAVTANLASQS